MVYAILPSKISNIRHKNTKTLSIQHLYTSIIYRHNKQAAEVAAKSKYFLGSNYRTSEAIKPKSAATLSTIAATFCSIIIEQIFTTPTKPYKKYTFYLFFLRY